MARKKIKTGQEELDRLRDARNRAQASYRYAREAAGNFLTGQQPKSSMELMGILEKASEWEQNYVNPIKASRKKMAMLSGGSSMDKQGQIVKSVSPSIPRNPQTGARTGVGRAPGPEYKLDAAGANPKQQTSNYLAQNKAVIEAKMNAKTVGSQLATQTRTLSKQLAALGESAKKEFGMDLNTFYSKAGGAIRNPERVQANQPKITTVRTGNTPVNPSVRPINAQSGPTKVVGSKFEPIKGPNIVPSVFKNAFGDGGGPTNLKGIAGFGVLSAGLDELLFNDRGADGSGGGSGLHGQKKR